MAKKASINEMDQLVPQLSMLIVRSTEARVQAAAEAVARLIQKEQDKIGSQIADWTMEQSAFPAFLSGETPSWEPLTEYTKKKKPKESRNHFFSHLPDSDPNKLSNFLRGLTPEQIDQWLGPVTGKQQLERDARGRFISRTKVAGGMASGRIIYQVRLFTNLVPKGGRLADVGNLEDSKIFDKKVYSSSHQKWFATFDKNRKNKKGVRRGTKVQNNRVIYIRQGDKFKADGIVKRPLLTPFLKAWVKRLTRVLNTAMATGSNKSLFRVQNRFIYGAK